MIKTVIDTGAFAAEADYLITGDKDFDEAQKLVQTTIISVSQFKKLVMEKWSRARD